MFYCLGAHGFDVVQMRVRRIDGRAVLSRRFVLERRSGGCFEKRRRAR